MLMQGLSTPSPGALIGTLICNNRALLCFAQKILEYRPLEDLLDKAPKCPVVTKKSTNESVYTCSQTTTSPYQGGPVGGGRGNYCAKNYGMVSEEENYWFSAAGSTQEVHLQGVWESQCPRKGIVRFMANGTAKNLQGKYKKAQRRAEKRERGQLPWWTTRFF